MKLLTISLSIIFLALGLIHMYWAVGGKWGFDSALPTNEQGSRLFTPRPIHSALVGVLLLFFALVYAKISGLISFHFPHWILQYGSWIIPSIFTIRAIGDFKYVGFFKKVRNTTFGKYDSRFYSPLCLTIGLIGLLNNIL